MRARNYILRVTDWISQGVNTVVFNGDPDESLSGRAWREENRSVLWSAMRRLIDAVFFWEGAHCRSSYLADIERAAYRLSIHRLRVR